MNLHEAINIKFNMIETKNPWKKKWVRICVADNALKTSYDAFDYVNKKVSKEDNSKSAVTTSNCSL